MADALTDDPAAALSTLPVATFHASGLSRSDDGQVHLQGHRITLQDIVIRYSEGQSVEQIVAHFPTLGLSQVHRVLAFYLDHRAAVDGFVTQEEQRTAEQRRNGPPGPSMAELRARLADRREE